MSKITESCIETQSNVSPLDALLKQGAQALIMQAVETELMLLLDNHKEELTLDGKQAIVRNGYLPQRNVLTALGEIAVKIPKVRDRNKTGVKFNSSIIPPYLKRSQTMSEFIPWLYLRGISTGDMSNALSVLLGQDVSISHDIVSRLKKEWEEEYKTWQNRNLSSHNIVYLWADGIYSTVRLDDDKVCLLVIMGADDKGNKHLLAVHDGMRESTQSWIEVLLDLKSRGLNEAKLAVGDGAMGFWTALQRIYPNTEHQRCWFHKMGNIINKLPKSKHEHANKMIKDIYLAETEEEAFKAYDLFVKSYEDKYPDAVKCLTKDKDSLFSFYKYPAKNWRHIRTTNPIESTFSTIRHRSGKMKNCGSKTTTLTMIFKLAQCASTKWNRLCGFEHLAEIISGVQFKDGIKLKQAA